MNTVIKTLCLTLSLCAVSAYASEQLSGEHKGSGSPHSALSVLMNIASVSSVGSVNYSKRLPTNHDVFEIDEEAIKQTPEGCLTAPELEYLRENATREPLVIFGVAPFPATHTVQKKSLLARLCCCCCK